MARSIGSGSSRSVAQVGALHAHHARVVAQALDQLGAAHVDRVDDPRAARQEDVGEAAGRGAGVQAGEARRVDPEGVKRGLELVRPPGSPTAASRARETDASGATSWPGLQLPVAVELHVAGVDEGLGLGARPGQAALGQELVESDARHGRDGSGGPGSGRILTPRTVSAASSASESVAHAQ